MTRRRDERARGGRRRSKVRRQEEAIMNEIGGRREDMKRSRGARRRSDYRRRKDGRIGREPSVGWGGG